ncbi:hypothetical protein [Bradyrhizobium sp. USDA 4473]
MDPQHFNAFNVPASSHVQHAVSEAPQRDEAVQFEQRLAEASQAAPVAIRDPAYPNLSTEDQHLIERVITQYKAQKKPTPGTVRHYTQVLHRLVNDLRTRGQTTDLADHESLLEYANTYFPNDSNIKAGLRVLGAYHGIDSNYPHLSPEDLSLIDRIITQYAPHKSVLPATATQYSTALRRLANDVRARGQTIDLADHKFLLDHTNTYFPKDEYMKRGLSVLLAYYGRDPAYPNLSTEDRNLIDRVITQFAAWKNPKPETVERYTRALRQLANDFRGRGRTTDLTDHKSLLEYANAYFPNNGQMRSVVGVLRKYYAPDDNAAPSRAAKRLRTLNDLEEIAVYRQPSANVASEGSSAAPQVDSRGVIIRGQSDRRPVYSEDAAAVSELEQALIKGGMTSRWAGQLGSSLVGFSRWLFENNRSSIVARLDRKALSDDGAILKYKGGNNATLLKALEYFHTFRTTGVVVPTQPGRASAKLNASDQNVALNPESAVQMLPRRIDDAAAQHSARHEASTRLEELGEGQDGQHAPWSLIQEQTALDTEQLPQGELRRVLDHLDDEAMPPPASLASEELQRLEKQLHNELHGPGDNDPALSFYIDPEEFTLDRELFSPEELLRPLDDEPAEELRRLERQLHDELHALGANHPAPSVDPEEFTLELEQFSPGELRQLLDHEPAEEIQQRRHDHLAPSASAQAGLDSEQLPQGELRRVLDYLDDEAMPSAVSVALEELQRIEKQFPDEPRVNHPALSFPTDPEDLTLDRELFSPEELLRPLSDEPAEELQQSRDDQPAPSAFVQAQAASHSEQLPQAALRRVLDHLEDEAMPLPASVASNELQRLEKQLRDEFHGLGDNHPALSFSVDQEDLTFDLERFSPRELRRLLDEEPAEEAKCHPRM